MTNLVFLDIDGVLNSHESFERGEKLVPQSVAYLNDLVNCLAITGRSVEFVISSTWRKAWPVSELIDQLREKGFTGQIAGVTPYIDGIDVERGTEIAAYLKTFPGKYCRHIDGVVILDDDGDMGTLVHRLVQTDPRHGLVGADVARAVDILKEPFSAELEL